MFGVSLSELLVIAVIALIVIGPQKLPGMLRNLGQWIARLRRLTTEVRAQTGIDEVLREEGIDGVRELRSLLRGELTASRGRARDGYEDTIEVDEAQEFPPEGADASGALPDDLLDNGADDDVVDAAATAAPTNGSDEHDAAAGEATSAVGAVTEVAEEISVVETRVEDAIDSAAPTRPLPPRPNRETKS